MKNQRKLLPVGIDNFKKVIEDGYYYVDKTLFIKDLINLKSEVNLFTRPRRFGKTLNMSMLRYFFGLDGDKDLFNGLNILDAGDQYTKYMGQYPVISLSFKSAKQPDFYLAFLSIKREISKVYGIYEDILPSLGKNRKRFERIMEAEGDVGEYIDAVQFLSECLEQHYHKRVIILLDEYDVPLENAYFEGFYREMSHFLRSLLESALKSNDSLEFAVLTGCLRVSKESIFTGLNNLEIISILNKGYNEFFGFEENEVQKMLAYYGLSEKQEIIRRWYGGYMFGNTEVYNPWSIIRIVKDFHQNPDVYPISYWGNTSSNNIVRKMIDRSDDLSAKAEIESLLQGERVVKPIHEDITYDEIYDNLDNMWNFMFFTGYLKKEREWMDDNGNRYISLMLPNLEIGYIFRNKIYGWFQEEIKEKDLSVLYSALLERKTNILEDFINELLLEIISFEDYHENFYHGFLLGCFSGMENYIVKSNREAGFGRGDITIRYANRKGKAVILELKCTKYIRELEKKCKEALKQIEDMKYDQELKEEGYSDILKYGIAFCKKECMVKLLL